MVVSGKRGRRRHRKLSFAVNPLSAFESFALIAMIPFGVGRPGGERDRDDLAALTVQGQDPITPVNTEPADVGTPGCGDPQPADGRQRDEGVPGPVGPGRRRPASRRPRYAPTRVACDS
jgi:hypothetical protein